MKVHYHAFFSPKALSNCFDTVLMNYSHFKVKHNTVQNSANWKTGSVSFLFFLAVKTTVFQDMGACGKSGQLA